MARVSDLALAGALAVLAALALPDAASAQSGGARPAAPAPAPTLSDLDRERGMLILKDVRRELEEHYVDPSLHGMDVARRFGVAEERIRRATSNGEVFGVIAQVLTELNDSHTFFVPPERATRVDYGWDMQIVGDSAYVVQVTPGSDAAAQGLAPGDLVVTVNGFVPTRENQWKLDYLFHVLRPQPGLRVVRESPAGRRDTLDLAAKVTPGRPLVALVTPSGDDSGLRELLLDQERREAERRDQFAEVGDVLVWRMNRFGADREEVDRVMNRARRFGRLVIDLRENPGGLASTVERILAHLVDHDTALAVVRTRVPGQRRVLAETLTVKPARGAPYAGRVLVLVDSRSAAGAEIFSRLVQVLGLGTVLGDRTTGAVVGGCFFPKTGGVGRIAPWGVNVTVSDVVMMDGERLEGRGVMPDELVTPTPAQLAAGHDPALSRALAIAGVTLPPDRAARLLREP